MPPASRNDTALQGLIDLANGGDAGAWGELLAHACERLRRLARKMLRGYPDVRRWETTDDLLQNALIRLDRALAEVRPQSVRHFFNLATVQIRRELLDLADHHFGPEGQGAKHHTDGQWAADDDGGGALQVTPDSTGEPATLDAWTDFHTRMDLLPEEEREVVGLLWYEGLGQEEAASVLGISVRTVKRRWASARLLLVKALAGKPPE